MNEPNFDLDRMLDDAASQYLPVPDAARLQRLLTTRHRRRGVMVVGSAAACLALLGGTVFALKGQDQERRLTPMHEADGPDRTDEDHEPTIAPPRTTEEREHDETDEPTSTESDHTTTSVEVEPTEPPHDTPTTIKKVEPPHTEPTHTTEPKHTDPPATDPPDTTEPPDGGGEVEWSAHQVHGESDANPPFDVFYGTAQPGSTIAITSPYGNISTTANENGGWEVRLYFNEAPFGEPFQVWVSSGEHLDDFWFTRVG